MAIQVMADCAINFQESAHLQVELLEIDVGLLELFVRLFSLEFSTAPRGEYLQRSDILLRGLHGLRVQNRQMPDRSPLSVSHWHANIALSTDFLDPEVFREFLP